MPGQRKYGYRDAASPNPATIIPGAEYAPEAFFTAR
jgi:hypothetical protein